jgi:adenylate kinase family enzyme
MACYAYPMTPQTFVFIGRSGCGNGTQADLLAKRLTKSSSEHSIFRLETGQRFREFTAAPGYTSSLAKSIQEEGGLQPSFLAVWIWADILIEKMKGNEHVIIDGTPRKIGEAIIFADAMKFYSRQSHIIYLNVSREWSEARLSERHRSDDAQAVVKHRLDWFDTDVMPAIEYFRTNDAIHFHDINGERTVEEIHEEIVGKVGL